MNRLFEDVQKQMIRDEFAKGMSQVELSKKYGVARATVQNVIRGYHLPKKTVQQKREEITMENWNEKARESHERLLKRVVIL